MSKVSVLVVDDASFIRDLVKKCLRNYFPGIKIEDAVNGRKAQAILARETFDLVLCDWEMPEMCGLELLTWCREQDHLRTLPFIMVTSRGDKENVVQAIQAGVSGYVSKPFTNEQLLTKVKHALNKAGKLDPKNRSVLNNKGNVYNDMRNPAAVDTFTKLVRITPSDAELQRSLGRAYWFAGEYDKAEMRLNLALFAFALD